jgi:putative ABC transport system ATP-binding protein
MLELENICKYYESSDMETRALHNVNLSIGYGEFIMVIGPSGSGKSTLLHILGCLDTPSKGVYLIEDIPADNLSAEQKAKIRNEKMGFIFQSFNLIPELTVFENVQLPLIYRGSGKKEYHERTKYVLECVGLSNRSGHYPNQLSGGQQQRAAIARALVGNPIVLFADEPTGNLDTDTGIEIMELLAALNQDEKMTIVMVTHNEKHFKYGKRIIQIQDGKVNEKDMGVTNASCVD